MDNKKRINTNPLIERREASPNGTDTRSKPFRGTRRGGLILRSGRRSGRGFGWRGPSPAGVSPFFS